MHGSINYGKWEDLVNSLIGRRIVEWTNDALTLDDGRVLTIEESDSDCCARSYSEFSGVILDVCITNVERWEAERYVGFWGEIEIVDRVKVTFLHDQNIIATANYEVYNDAFYYSVCSLVVSGIHYGMVRDDEG
ncbi:hypothetical protein [Abiotrophia defectiva]|uniref:DUF7448 domain-containing protein n=1 Tax=Abiotrophia defectiva TaxID=46125 RepID=UPI0026F1AC33|nr:hypothetical protein [Abiotrophia defectiva]